jgi:small subunit ribosomal protein S4
MSKRSNAKYKLDRRMGENIWGRPKSPVNKREYGPGQHGQRRKGKVSDFGIQLRAKQKLKGYYGDVTEKQFRKVYAEAVRMKGDTSQNLIGLLEQRLDMVIYRAKWAPTVFAARQIVNHGHIWLNGVRCNIGSARVKPGDVLELGPKAREMALVLEAQSLSERDVPEYVSVDGNKASYVRVPTLDEVPYPVKMEPNLVVEFYSRGSLSRLACKRAAHRAALFICAAKSCTQRPCTLALTPNPPQDHRLCCASMNWWNGSRPMIPTRMRTSSTAPMCFR